MYRADSVSRQPAQRLDRSGDHSLRPGGRLYRNALHQDAGQPVLAWRDRFRHHRGRRYRSDRGHPAKTGGGSCSRLERGDVLAATTQVARPIFFATLIIITAYLPLFAFERAEAKLFTPMAYTVSYALFGALLCSFTLIPGLAYMAFRKPRPVFHNRPLRMAAKRLPSDPGAYAGRAENRLSDRWRGADSRDRSGHDRRPGIPARTG